MLSPTRIDRPSLRPGTGYLIAPRVPHGLATVVEGLAREVLRHRPEDIYVFAARHFEKLLRLREEYHAEEYDDREFNHEFSRDFNLWPTKETRNVGKSPNDGWSLEKEIETLERREQVSADVEESQEDTSTDRETRRASKQATSRDPATARKTSRKSKDKETTSDTRATRIMSQMTALRGPGKNIQTKDIKQELRRNKLSGEKSKAIDGVEKGIRGDRRSRTRSLKKDKDPEEEVESTTTTTSRTSARKPLKKVRRIETESETETERDVAAKAGVENGHVRLTVKHDRASREAIARTRGRERGSEARLSEHSSERKVSSRALSMDRIRTYVLRKFASTASLEVLRSPTYVEQVQEVIDRAAPIIKEKLEEIGLPRGKRSRSVDLAWNGESLYRHVREEGKHGDHDKEERGKSGNRLERKADIVKKEEMEDSFGRDETMLNAGREENKSRRRSVGSGKRSRRRENGDFGVVDQVDDNSKHSNKLEREFGATYDTLEARLTATQSILEDISKSTSVELGDACKSERPTGSDPFDSEISDHVNVVSLPVVRPPSSKNSRNATKNGSDNLTLPPISPEAPKSTKKKDELSLPVLSTVANNGNHSVRKSQERDVLKEASRMHEIMSDIEDIIVLSENEKNMIVDRRAKQDPGSDRQDLTLDVKFINEEERVRDEDGIFRREDAPAKTDEKRGSLGDFEELEKLGEGRRSEEVFRDSLNVTPEMMDVPLRPDSLEPDSDEIKLQDDNPADPVRENTFEGLKDKLIEIEMAERNIEKALACQQAMTCDIGETTSQAEKSVTDGKINETGEPTNEVEEAMSEIRKSTDAGKIPINEDNKRKKNNDDEKRKSIDDIEETKDTTISNEMEKLNIGERLTSEIEKMESEVKGSSNETENSRNKIKIANGIRKSMTENEAERLKSKAKVLKNGDVEKTTDQTEIITKATENAVKVRDERSMDKTEKSINENLSNGVEEVAVKAHENVQSTNPKLHSKDSQITEAVETGGDNVRKTVENAANGFSKSATSENIMVKSEFSIMNFSNENGKTKARKKRESDELPVMTPLSLEVPYSYVLSEGSPCEIPDSVTTVIIPDRSYSSPVALKDDDYRPRSMNHQKEESLIRFDITKEISKDEKQEKNQHEYGMEIFGEYVRPEATVLPVDTDFIRGVKGVNSNQDLVIIRQDLNRIKEEGEEEDEKEDSKRNEIEDHQEKKNNKETIKEEEMMKVAMLENIVEHEETEETDVRTIGAKDPEEISFSGILECESLSDKNLIIDTDLANENGKADVAAELRSMPENLSEESGSTQGTHTTTSSDVKESTASNRSIESPSPGRPVVPELNLDSLQDNTVSSFKMTINGTEKEDNNSLRGSDATTSLIEPLTSDERLINHRVDHEEEIVAEELTEVGLQSEAPEADQLYRAEHAEYEWLGKDPLSTDINLEDEAKSEKDSIGLRESVVQIDPQETEELGSEEEIARELIDLLDKDMQFRAEKLDSRKDSGESEKSNLDTDDKSDQLLSASMHSMSVEQEKRDRKDSLNKIDDVITEATSELSDNMDINQDNKNAKRNAIIKKETERIKLEVAEEAHIENLQVAPLVQFEQDELLEENNKLETADERITILDIINNADYIQEKLEEKQTNVGEISKSQSSDSKIEEPNGKREEDEQEELQNQRKCEQEKLKAYEECKQEKLCFQEKIEQEKLKIQDKDDEENIKMEEEIVDVTVVSPEATEFRKDSMNESMKNDNEHEEETKSNMRDESITDNRVEKDEKEKEKKTEDHSEKIESVHGPITSAISEQSAEDRSHFRYWTTETKSSTVETVVEALDSNTSLDEKLESVTDAPEIIEDEFIRKKDDFHSAVVKIQACIRGFLMRRRMRRDLRLELVSNNVPPTQNIITSDHLTVPQDIPSLREARPLRREEALRNTTLSLENAFATGRLQHTGEFHDSVPLFPLDLNSKTRSVTSNDSLDEEINVEETNPPDITKSSESDSIRESSKRGTSFHKGNTFVDPTFPIVMHLLTDATRNFSVSQNSHSDFNASVGGVKLVEPAVDILMLGYPRDDENRYLNFITSVEDLGSNADSLTLDDMLKSTKNTDDAHPSTTSDEGSLREPLALPGVSQGVVIEEITSLDELVPSESTKPSVVPKTSLNTNSSMPSEERALEDMKSDLGLSPRMTNAREDQKQGAEGQEPDRKSEKIGENDLREDASKRSNETSRDKHVEEENGSR